MANFIVQLRVMGWDQHPRPDAGYGATPAVPKGKAVWAIVHTQTRLEFSYAYTNKQFAELVAEKFEEEAPNIAGNFRASFVSVSDREEDD